MTPDAKRLMHLESSSSVVESSAEKEKDTQVEKVKGGEAAKELFPASETPMVVVEESQEQQGVNPHDCAPVWFIYTGYSLSILYILLYIYI